MRKIGDLMKELGFNANASDEVKKAFIKNLIRQAYGVEVQEETPAPVEKEKAQPPQQLTFALFDPEDLKKRVRASKKTGRKSRSVPA